MARILIAEDDLDISRLIQFQLNFSGHEVVVASDGMEALELARSMKPDLMLIDWMMPRMDGLQVLLSAKADPVLNQLPIILMTAKAQSEDIRAGMEAGATAYLIKPFPLEHLISTISEVLQ